MEKEKKVFQYTMEKELWKRFKIQCTKDDTTMSQKIIQLIENYVKKGS